MKKFWWVALVCALIGTTACSKGKNQRKLNKSETFTLAYRGNIRSLHPRIGNDIPATLFVKMLFEGLMRKNAQGEVECGVADRYTLSEDGCVYTFYLKKTYWSNGDLVTAHDFEHSWKSSITPGTARTGSMCFYILKNAIGCLAGEVSSDEVGVKALDDLTLTVTLENPAPYFLSLTTCSTYAPVNKQNELEHSNWYMNHNEHFVCNGPFKISDWRKGNQIILERNASYWDKEGVKLKRIHAIMVEDENVQVQMFKNHELDYLGSPFSSVSADQLMHKALRPLVKNVPTTRVEWLFVNVTKPPFDNKNFRKALAYSINRKAIAEHIYQLGETPAMGILGESFGINKEGYFTDNNIDRAKHLLSQVQEEEEVGHFTINFSPASAESRLVQALQDQWREIGLDVSLRQQEWSVHFQSCVEGDFDVAKMGWVSWLDDPIYILQTFRKKELATNMSRWYSPKYEALLDASDQEKDVEKRKGYLRAAEEHLMEELPVIPIVFAPARYLHHDYIKGVVISPLLEIDLKFIEIDAEKKFSYL